MSWLGGDDYRSRGRMFGGGVDHPWWAAEETQTVNRTVLCQHPMPEYHVVTAVICSMLLVFGLVYSLFGYRCFKAVMFLTGLMFASVVVYLICLSEDLLPVLGNAGVALGAGILFGLITMLVQYVGLFMTGFHTGLLLGVALIAAVHYWWSPPSVWAVVGLLLVSGLLLAVMTLYFQKGLTIFGTAMSGGAIIAATMDYFVEELLMVKWFRDLLMGEKSENPCWFSWFILGIWPFMLLLGTFTQWKISGKGIYHQQMVPPATKSRNVNLNRVRSREARAELRQKKYRYLYQVRTAHGDIISQEYVQSLQRKAYPTSDNGTLQSDSTHTTMLPSDQAQLHPLTESEDEGLANSSAHFRAENKPPSNSRAENNSSPHLRTENESLAPSHPSNRNKRNKYSRGTANTSPVISSPPLQLQNYHFGSPFISHSTRQ